MDKAKARLEELRLTDPVAYFRATRGGGFDPSKPLPADYKSPAQRAAEAQRRAEAQRQAQVQAQAQQDKEREARIAEQKKKALAGSARSVSLAEMMALNPVLREKMSKPGDKLLQVKGSRVQYNKGASSVTEDDVYRPKRSRKEKKAEREDAADAAARDVKRPGKVVYTHTDGVTYTMNRADMQFPRFPLRSFIAAGIIKDPKSAGNEPLKKPKVKYVYPDLPKAPLVKSRSRDGSSGPHDSEDETPGRTTYKDAEASRGSTVSSRGDTVLNRSNSGTVPESVKPKSNQLSYSYGASTSGATSASRSISTASKVGAPSSSRVSVPTPKATSVNSGSSLSSRPQATATTNGPVGVNQLRGQIKAEQAARTAKEAAELQAYKTGGMAKLGTGRNADGKSAVKLADICSALGMKPPQGSSSSVPQEGAVAKASQRGTDASQNRGTSSTLQRNTSEPGGSKRTSDHSIARSSSSAVRRTSSDLGVAKRSAEARSSSTARPSNLRESAKAASSRPKKRREYYSDSDSYLSDDSPPRRSRREDDDPTANVDIWSLVTGKSRDYYSRKYKDDDDDLMEASAADIVREERKAARLAAEEDRKEEERLRKHAEAKKRRLMSS